MYLPYPPSMIWELAGGVDTTPVIPTVKRIRCDGCGKYMKSSTAYMIVEYSYLRCHMKEECITKLYTKAKEKRGEFELAAINTGVKYGKV